MGIRCGQRAPALDLRATPLYSGFMFKCFQWIVGSALLLGGCSTYEPASLKDGVISNPSVGWKGYSVRVPDGLIPVDETGNGAEFRKWYEDQASDYAADYYASFSEQLLFEPPDQTWILSFLNNTYAIRTGWGAMSSFETQYILQKMINRKMVIINDMKAHGEQIDVQGQRGWYVSGTCKPYFKKNPRTLAYEGIFLLGSLKEVYWFEAFGSEESRPAMKMKVHEMAESLTVY
jgi:hypothetical protein